MSAVLAPQDAERLKKLEEMRALQRDFQLLAYRAYPKQRAFHAMGAAKRERAFLAGNQCGKTISASREVAMHLTGWYPPWWEGKRFNDPVRWGIGSHTADLTRDGAQRLLLGKFGEFGTGAIPKANMKDFKLSRGTPEAVDLIKVRHASGGISEAVFKAYSDGRQAWQADTWHGAWLDEESPEDIYSEVLARTAVHSGLVMSTLTPLLGMSNVVSKFYPVPDTEDRGIVMMTIDEAEHFTPEQRAKIIAGYLPHERDARTKGIPMLGSGRIYPYADDMISMAPIGSIPPLWPRIVGIDFGSDHPTAAVWIARDIDAGVSYIYDCYRMKGGNVPIHASALRARGASIIPVAWPHDGLNETAVGPQLAKQYRDEGINMLAEHAQYDVVPGDSKENPKLARNSVEAGIQDLRTQMETGTLKVYSHLNDFFEEFRMYHRKDGKIVKVNDDLLDALRYANMMLRYADNNMKHRPVNAGRGGNWRTL